MVFQKDGRSQPECRRVDTANRSCDGVSGAVLFGNNLTMVGETIVAWQET